MENDKYSTVLTAECVSPLLEVRSEPNTIRPETQGVAVNGESVNVSVNMPHLVLSTAISGPAGLFHSVSISRDAYVEAQIPVQKPPTLTVEQADRNDCLVLSIGLWRCMHWHYLFVAIVWNAFVLMFSSFFLHGAVIGEVPFPLFIFIIPHISAGIAMTFYIVHVWKNRIFITVRSDGLRVETGPIKTVLSCCSCCWNIQDKFLLFSENSTQEVVCMQRRRGLLSLLVKTPAFYDLYLMEGTVKMVILKKLDRLEEALYLQQEIQHFLANVGGGVHRQQVNPFAIVM